MIRQAITLGRTHVALSAIAFVSASVSVVALLLHAAGWLPMYFLVDLLGAPSLVLLLALGAIAWKIDQPVFLNRLAVGAWGGLTATAAYDVVRLALWKSGLFNTNPFVSHPIFGKLITGLAETTATAQIVGWGYHFWNGFAFGLMYTLVVGRGKWWYALIWATFLEIGWLTALPSVLERRPNTELVIMSLIGHAAYGVGLGLIAQKYVRA